MRKLFLRDGYEIVAGGGKGSHWKLRKGKITVIIPNHKELKKGTEHALIVDSIENFTNSTHLASSEITLVLIDHQWSTSNSRFPLILQFVSNL